MYQYSPEDRRFLQERTRQFRDQLQRRLAGRLSEDQFRPLRLQNGLYQEKHAPMLRVAIPYGVLSARQLRGLASISRRFDRGYGHFTTRQNVQFNWPRLEQVPDILEALARLDMHAVQTSGNVVRNVTTDPLAGVANDEIADPRPYCELIRQWSTAHPEFSWLPRKFKIAVSGAASDRAATRVHDIGLRLRRGAGGAPKFEVWVGGGLGRTPLLAQLVRTGLDPTDLLSYLEAVLRVYNLQGRRDNLYKARIKILVHDLGARRFGELVEQEWESIRHGPLRLAPERLQAALAAFAEPDPGAEAAAPAADPARPAADPAFRAWQDRNVLAHRLPGSRAVTVTLKGPGRAPGNLTAAEMEALARIAERYSRGQLRTTREQNLVLPYVRAANLPRLWRALLDLDLVGVRRGSATDMVACPGAHYCSLANAGSIDIAETIGERLRRTGLAERVGALRLNISGCVNACGHHHIGDIGILGVEKSGAEWYQLTLGGGAGEDTRDGGSAAIGRRLGPAVPKAEIADTVERILHTYLRLRTDGERLADTLARVGLEPFQESVYGTDEAAPDRARPLAAYA